MAEFWGVGRLSTHQKVAYTGTAGTISNAVGSQTRKVRVVVTTDAYIAIGTAATVVATANDPFLPASSVEYFSINPGEKVSAIQVSSGGTLHVTEIT